MERPDVEGLLRRYEAATARNYTTAEWGDVYRLCEYIHHLEARLTPSPETPEEARARRIKACDEELERRLLSKIHDVTRNWARAFAVEMMEAEATHGKGERDADEAERLRGLLADLVCDCASNFYESDAMDRARAEITGEPSDG